MRPAFALLALLLASPDAAADEIAATRPDAAVLVTGGGATGVHHRLEPGKELSFPTAGPAEVTVEVRRRLPSVGARPPAVRVAVLGDGQPFMEIIAGQPAVAGAAIQDGRGGALSAPDRARVTVPAGGARLTLRSPAGSPDLLVRVQTRDGQPLPTP